MAKIAYEEIDKIIEKLAEAIDKKVEKDNKEFNEALMFAKEDFVDGYITADEFGMLCAIAARKWKEA